MISKRHKGDKNKEFINYYKQKMSKIVNNQVCIKNIIEEQNEKKWKFSLNEILYQHIIKAKYADRNSLWN